MDSNTNYINTVSGMLLYAKTDEERYPDYDYNMSGNKISVKTLDLNVKFNEIRKQLDNIVDNYFEKTVINEFSVVKV